MKPIPVRIICRVGPPLILVLSLFPSVFCQTSFPENNPSATGRDMMEALAQYEKLTPSDIPPAYYLQVFSLRCEGNKAEKEKCRNQAGRVLLLPPGEEGDVLDEIEPVARIFGGSQPSLEVAYVFPGKVPETPSALSFTLPGAVLEFYLNAETPADANQPRSLQMEFRKGKRNTILAQAALTLPPRHAAALVASPTGTSRLLVGLVTPLDPRSLKTSSSPRMVDDTIVPPSLLFKVEPEYPKSARAALRSGTVRLFGTIDSKGGVHIQGFPSIPENGGELAAAAYRAVKQWRYEPAKTGGQPVSVYFTVMVRFSL